jgi:hypothetical protein
MHAAPHVTREMPFNRLLVRLSPMVTLQVVRRVVCGPVRAVGRPRNQSIEGEAAPSSRTRLMSPAAASTRDDLGLQRDEL